MDQDYILDNDAQQQGAGGLYVTQQMANFLSETARWAKFLGILGFIGVGFMVLASFGVGAMFSQMGDISGLGGMPGWLFTIIYLGFAALYFFPVLYLYRFATHTQAALRNGGQTDLTLAFENLKSHYKFLGIAVALVLGLYVLMLIFAILFGVGTMMG